MSVKVITEHAGEFEIKHGLATTQRYIRDAIDGQEFVELDTVVEGSKIALDPKDIRALIKTRDDSGSTDDE